MEIANQIYSYIEEHHMSQAAVARAAGLTPAKFNDMLRGRIIIRAEHIIPICSALGCCPDELFGYGSGNVAIGTRKYHQITVIDSDNQVIAVITSDSVVEHDGYQVLLA